MEANYVILAAVSELCASRTDVPGMRDILLRLSKSYREISEREAQAARDLTSAGEDFATGEFA